MKIRNSELLKRYKLNLVFNAYILSNIFVPEDILYHISLESEGYICCEKNFTEIRKLKQNTLLGIIYGKELPNN